VCTRSFCNFFHAGSSHRLSSNIKPSSTLGPHGQVFVRGVEAKFPVVKTLDTFDFLAIPSANKTLVLDLDRCEFLSRKENVLLLGNSGTGKTHISLGLGLAACQRRGPRRQVFVAGVEDRRRTALRDLQPTL